MAHYKPIMNNQRSRHNIFMSDATLFTGIDIGVPLNIFSNVFTNLHYGYDITT